MLNNNLTSGIKSGTHTVDIRGIVAVRIQFVVRIAEVRRVIDRAERNQITFTVSLKPKFLRILLSDLRQPFNREISLSAISINGFSFSAQI